MAKTPAQRVADNARRKRDAGLVKVWAWCYPEDREAIRDTARRLREHRERQKTPPTE